LGRLFAGIIVGNGSTSFEIIRCLTERLPVMICPRWVVTRTQPIAVSDVLEYLQAALDLREAVEEPIEIGGSTIETYRSMMLAYARHRGLRRLLIRVPVLTPRLSSYWLDLVTPVPPAVSRPLIEGLRSESVCTSSERVFGVGFDGSSDGKQITFVATRRGRSGFTSPVAAYSTSYGLAQRDGVAEF
jgi:uncharacterized protein YbjT (DUF2867 family)